MLLEKIPTIHTFYICDHCKRLPNIQLLFVLGTLKTTLQLNNILFNRRHILYDYYIINKNINAHNILYSMLYTYNNVYLMYMDYSFVNFTKMLN